MSRTKAKGFYMACNGIKRESLNLFSVVYQNRAIKTKNVSVDCFSLSASTRDLVAHYVENVENHTVTFLIDRLLINYEKEISMCLASKVKINGRWYS